jgi:hypothetical protein
LGLQRDREGERGRERERGGGISRCGRDLLKGAALIIVPIVKPLILLSPNVRYSLSHTNQHQKTKDQTQNTATSNTTTSTKRPNTKHRQHSTPRPNTKHRQHHAPTVCRHGISQAHLACPHPAPRRHRMLPETSRPESRKPKAKSRKPLTKLHTPTRIHPWTERLGADLRKALVCISMEIASDVGEETVLGFEELFLRDFAVP